ncbi:MAG: CAP domain-containing protein [Anaerolineae bacterium]
MRRHLIAATLVVLIVLQVVCPAAPAVTATGSYEQQVVDLVNQERASRGLPLLTIHYMLENATEAHSMDMGANSFCGHGSSDGTSWSTRIQQHGYTPVYGLAENVACGQATPQQVVNAWMGSAGHRANILGDYAHIGVGYFDSGTAGYRHFWTMDFGKPAPNTPPAACVLQHDFNNSGIIDAGDISVVSQSWRVIGSYDPTYDVNIDQTINVIDVMMVSSELGTKCK